MMNTTVEFIVIGAYLLVLIAIAFAFKRFNSNASDYFRSGCRGMWWMVGASIFMTSFSAWTFTGAAGVAFKSGWSVMVIFLANAFGFFLNAIFLAPWFRQIRAISGPEVIAMRYGEGTRLFYAWLTVLFQLVMAGIPLYALAIFCSAVFGYDVEKTIVIIGAVVLFYSLLGGSWAVMATDFLQSLILLPMTILIALLCIREIGGVSELFHQIDVQGLTEKFRMINGDEFKGSFIDFSGLWAFGMILNVSIAYNSLGAASRYFAVKDGREARKAAWLACILMLLGSFVWLVPPVVSRLLYESDVMKIAISNNAETAYAIAGLKVLPVGMTGLMVVAMFAATMSSMDSGLNRNAAVLVNDIYPAFCRWLKIEPMHDRKLLFVSQICTFLMGVTTMFFALYFSRQKNASIFHYMQVFGAVIGAPLAVPMFMGLFVKKSPPWSAIFTICCASVSSTIGYLSGAEFLKDIPWLAQKFSWHAQVFMNLGTGILAFFLTMPFWKYSSTAYKEKTDKFFTLMKTPVDFKKEVGENMDYSQLIIMGIFSMLAGLFVCSLIILPGNDWSMGGRCGILFVGFFVLIVGFLLYYSGTKKTKRTKEIRDEENCIISFDDDIDNVSELGK